MAAEGGQGGGPALADEAVHRPAEGRDQECGQGDLGSGVRPPEALGGQGLSHNPLR